MFLPLTHVPSFFFALKKNFSFHHAPQNVLDSVKCIFWERKEMDSDYSSITNFCKCNRCSTGKGQWRKSVKNAARENNDIVGIQSLLDCAAEFDHYCCHSTTAWTERMVEKAESTQNSSSVTSALMGSPARSPIRPPIRASDISQEGGGMVNPNMNHVMGLLNEKTMKCVRMKKKLELQEYEYSQDLKSLEEQLSAVKLERDELKRYKELQKARKANRIEAKKASSQSGGAMESKQSRKAHKRPRPKGGAEGRESSGALEAPPKSEPKLPEPTSRVRYDSDDDEEDLV